MKITNIPSKQIEIQFRGESVGSKSQCTIDFNVGGVTPPGELVVISSESWDVQLVDKGKRFV